LSTDYTDLHRFIERKKLKKEIKEYIVHKFFHLHKLVFFNLCNQWTKFFLHSLNGICGQNSFICVNQYSFICVNLCNQWTEFFLQSLNRICGQNSFICVNQYSFICVNLSSLWTKFSLSVLFYLLFTCQYPLLALPIR